MVEADPFERARQTQAVLRRLATLPGVVHVERVDPQQLEKQLAPWLGTSFDTTDVPIPDMVDVDLASRANALSEITQAVKSVAPSARIDAHGQWLTPLNKLMNLLKWLALALVVLMAAATAFTVVLAARATLDNHRDTIDVMHLLGGTDVQIARLFQRRIALDALFGGIVGLAAAAVVLLLLVERVRGLGSELVGNIALTSATWTALILFPLGGTALAMVTARLTILRTLGRIL
jgi:cell division transport system permease protein